MLPVPMHAATQQDAQTNLGNVNDVGGKRGAHVAMRLPGVVQEAGLQRDEAIAAQADLRSSRDEGQSRRCKGCWAVCRCVAEAQLTFWTSSRSFQLQMYSTWTEVKVGKGGEEPPQA